MGFLPENLSYKRFYLKLRSLILNWDFRFKQSLSQRLERKDKRRKAGQEGGRKEGSKECNTEVVEKVS